ncbi:MAG: MFS transporter, partial [Acidimicrobiales bacterium]
MPTDTGWRPLGPPSRSSTPPPSPFSRLAVAHLLSMAGDAMVTIALAGSLFFDISPTAARGKVAISLALTMAPFAVVAPLLGPAIDRSRWGRRAMVVVSAAGRAVACLLMARVIDGLLLFPVAFASLVLSKGYSVARGALVPSVVDEDHELVAANSRLAVGGAVAGLVAALPGVALLRLAGGDWVLRVAAVVFVATAVAGVRIIETRRAETPEMAAAGDAEIRGIGIVMAAASMALLRALVGFTAFLLAFGFRRLDAPEWWFGVALAASMAGTVLGAGIAPHLRGLVGEERILVGSLVVVAAAGAQDLTNPPPGQWLSTGRTYDLQRY